MEKAYSTLGFVLLLSLILIGSISAQLVTNVPTTDPKAECEKSGGTWYAPINYCAHCPEGKSLTIRTEGSSTIYDCEKKSSGMILLQPPQGTQDISEGFTEGQQTPLTEKSQAEIECLKKGCFLNNVCFPFGFVNNGTYCSEKGKFITAGIYRPAFINQSDAGMNCSQDYECKTGVCSNNVCIDLTAIKAEINDLKEDLTTLSQQNNELNSSLSEINQTVEENNNLLQKITNFLKDWFGFS